MFKCNAFLSNDNPTMKCINMTNNCCTRGTWRFVSRVLNYRYARENQVNTLAHLSGVPAFLINPIVICSILLMYTLIHNHRFHIFPSRLSECRSTQPSDCLRYVNDERCCEVWLFGFIRDVRLLVKDVQGWQRDRSSVKDLKSVNQ